MYTFRIYLYNTWQCISFCISFIHSDTLPFPCSHFPFWCYYHFYYYCIVYRLPFQVYKNGYFLICHLLFYCKKVSLPRNDTKRHGLRACEYKSILLHPWCKNIDSFWSTETKCKNIFSFSLTRNLLANHIFTYIILEISSFHSTCFERM